MKKIPIDDRRIRRFGIVCLQQRHTNACCFYPCSCQRAC